VGGALVYQLLDAQGLVSQASVLPSATSRRFNILVPQLGGQTLTGLAIANTEQTAASITLQFVARTNSNRIGDGAAATGASSCHSSSSSIFRRFQPRLPVFSKSAPAGMLPRWVWSMSSEIPRNSSPFADSRSLTFEIEVMDLLFLAEEAGLGIQLGYRDS